MSEVKVIKASKDGRTSRGRTIELLRVAAYCRVSTDTEDQMNSYNSQLQYYTDLISKNPKWEMVDIYADAAITGTKADKRDGFQSMIADCLHGKVDQIITKSISRFARNTVDTLKYVRLLKEHNVAVIFEDEGINTMTMDGELLLTVLSSVAQQEVENISANVKKGLKMKMQRGEMVGFNGCLGYDYDPETKTISVNENERHIVEYIFDRYVQGAGCLMIAKELRRAGEKKKDGTTDWKDSQIRGIIRNVKYMGDLVMGKTFTVDPITKRRLKNLGEEDMYYIENNHEPIISRELFEKAQEIRERRAGTRKSGRHQPNYKQYAFSGILVCGFCGHHLSRKTTNNDNLKYKKHIWQCSRYLKYGKKNCPKCKLIREEMIENAFLDCYKYLCSNHQSLVVDAIDEAFSMIASLHNIDELESLQKEIALQKTRRQRLLDLNLAGKLDTETFSKKLSVIDADITALSNRIRFFEREEETQEKWKTELNKLKEKMKQGMVLEKFDRRVFESIVDYIIIGDYDDEGNADPYNMTLVLKTGDRSSVDGKNYIPQRSNAAHDSTIKQGKSKRIELFKFDSHCRHQNFQEGEYGREKHIENTIKVTAAINGL